MKFDPLFVTPQWLKEYHTKYPHGMSVLENIIEWVNMTNKLIEYVNLSPDKILEIMETWKTDGTLADIINNDVLSNKADKVKLKEVTDQNLRVGLISDIHYSPENYKGIKPHDRLNYIVNMMNSEHQKKPFDMVFITGDLSSNNGSTIEAVKRYFDKLQMPYYILAGNHDLVSVNEWANNFHYGRDYSLVFGDYAFLIADTFNGPQLAEEMSYGQQPSAVDMVKLSAKYEKLKDKTIFALYHGMFGSSHHADLKAFILEKDNILAGFEGHWHTNGSVDLGGKKSYRNGHFSYESGGSEIPPWTFRTIEKEGSELVTKLIQPALTIGTYPQTYQVVSTEVLAQVAEPIADIYLNIKEQSLSTGDMLNSVLTNVVQNKYPTPLSGSGISPLLLDNTINVDSVHQTGMYYVNSGNGAPVTGFMLVMGYTSNNFAQVIFPINSNPLTNPIYFRSKNSGNLLAWKTISYASIV